MFITFEGLDGAGKSTQINRLLKKMQLQNLSVVCTREPGGTEIGDHIRGLLLNPAHTSVGPLTEVFLYAASRAQLLFECIHPALAEGKIVICDRFVDASIAYQGAGLGIGVDTVRAVNEFATQGLLPDITFLFDLDVHVSRERVFGQRKDVPPDRIEQRDLEYFHRVRLQFLRIASEDRHRVTVLDATLAPETLEQEIWTVIENYLKKQGR